MIHAPTGFFEGTATQIMSELSTLTHQNETAAQKSNRATLDAALALGEQDITAGRTFAYTPSLLKQIEQNARWHAYDGKKPNPDVIW